MPPVVLITESIGLTNVDLAEATTNYSGFRHNGGGTPTPVLETDLFVQGLGAISIKTSGTSRDEGVWYDNVGGVDLTTNANKHVYLWGAVTTISQHATISGGGIYIIVASATGDWNKYFVNGSDTIDSRFVRYVIDVTKQPSEVAGTIDLTAITHIGIGVKGTITARGENVILDRIDYGTGLSVEQDPITWQDIFDQDNDITKKWGIIEKRGEIFFLKGGIRIGDLSGTASTIWLDGTNSVVEWENPLYHNGDGVVSAITAADLYRIEIVGNGTGTTDVKWGEVIGTGDERQGVLGGVIRSAGPRWTFDCDGDIADVDSVELYGLQVQGAGTCSFDNASKTRVIGTNFVQCGEIIPNVCEWLNNKVISPEPLRGLLFDGTLPSTVKQTQFVFSKSNIRSEADKVWIVDVSATPDLFLDLTVEFSSDSIPGGLLFMPTSEGVGDYAAFGRRQQFTRIHFNINTAGSSGTVIWEYWSSQSGGSWVALPNVNDKTNNLTASGSPEVDFDLPNDWVEVSLNGESPIFYIRNRVLTAYFTNPSADNADFRRIVEHLVHMPDLGTETFDALEFFGTGVEKFHIENSTDAVEVGGVSTLDNGDTNQIVGDGTTDGIAQSFAGVAGTLSSIQVRMNKLAAPTGDIAGFLYAHSGSFGSSSIPTGAPLATAELIPIFDIVGNVDQLYTFKFLDEFLMSAGTDYVFAIEYTDGDGSNHLLVRYDASSPTPTGNKSTLASAVWSAQSGHDIVYHIGAGAVVTIEATEGSNPTTSITTGIPQGAVIIINSQIIEVTGVTEGTRVSIHRSDNNLELLNALAFTSDGLGAFKATANFGYEGDQGVNVRARSQGKPVAAVADDGTVLTDETIAANDAAANVTLTPAVPVVNDAYYFGHTEEFGKIAIHVSTAGADVTLTWEYWNGSSWASLSGLIDGTTNFEGDGIVEWTIPGDWATQTVNSQGPYKYIRARVSAIGGSPTGATGAKVTLDVIRYLAFSQDNTIVSTGLSVKATWVEDTTARFPTEI